MLSLSSHLAHLHSFVTAQIGDFRIDHFESGRDHWRWRRLGRFVLIDKCLRRCM